MSTEKKSKLNVGGLTVDQKFAKALFVLRDLRPFYSAIYESIPHIETKSIDTMGVTSKELLYNEDFVDKLTFGEFLFVVLHEIGHIALMHVSRMGGRDSTLWNIACDLYDNKILSEEFDLRPGGMDRKTRIAFPTDALYCESISIYKDYAEDIYRSLEEQAIKNGYFEKISNDNRGGSGSNGGGDTTFRFNVKGQGIGGGYTFDVDVQTYQGDLQPSGLDEQEEINNSKRILAEAKTKYDMTYKSIGGGKGFLELMVDELLKSHIDWKKLLRKFCIQMTKSDQSYAMPDKRMFYQKAIYPGQAVDITNIIKGVKICFDSSGSISLNDMRHFYGQVYQLLKDFKVDAEVMFWDTHIEKKCSLTKTFELKRLTGKGGGGTNPDCLFKYFDSKACKVKPYVILVFTDGYIGGNQAGRGWRRKYKNTIWVMTKNYNKTFSPKFGTVTVAQFNNKK